MSIRSWLGPLFVDVDGDRDLPFKAANRSIWAVYWAGLSWAVKAVLKAWRGQRG